MTDHKFTDDEIIKALECCKKHGYNFEECERCPCGGQCYTDDVNLCQDVLDLINCQKAKIEELSEVLSGTIRIRYAEAKVEAIKEFAERLKEKLIKGGIYPVLVKNSINDLVKEMTEENT